MRWRTVYVLKPHLQDEALLAHQLVHIAQIEREGPVPQMPNALSQRPMALTVP